MLIARLFRQSGATLVELMVTMVILGIILAIATPSMQAYVLRGQLRSGVEAIYDGLMQARSESIKRNTTVAFILQTVDGDWQILDANGSVITDRHSKGEGTKNIDVAPSSSGASISVPATVTFNGLGQISANADGSASISSMLVTLPGSSLSDSRRIDIGFGGAGSVTGGLIRVCDPSISSSNSPLRCY